MVSSTFDGRAVGQTRLAAEGPNDPRWPTSDRAPGAMKLGGSRLGRARLRINQTGSKVSVSEGDAFGFVSTTASYTEGVPDRRD